MEIKQQYTQSSIIWPKEFLPGFTDNFCSKEIWPHLIDTSIWESYYKNCSDIVFTMEVEKKLANGTRFSFKTFGFVIEAEVTTFQPPNNNNPGRISWHGWDAKGIDNLDVTHAWLIEDLPGDGVRVLKQESQKGKAAQKLSTTLPNPMINGHQDWLDGLVNSVKKSKNMKLPNQ